MKSISSVVLLASAAFCVPHVERPRHQLNPRLASPFGSNPFDLKMYRRQYNGTFPSGGSYGGSGGTDAGTDAGSGTGSGTGSDTGSDAGAGNGAQTPIPSPNNSPYTPVYPSSTPDATPTIQISSSSQPPSSRPLPDKTLAGSSAPGKIQFAGVNIAGCDFGCQTDGTCGSPGAVCPSEVGPTQMQHFKSKDGFNIFRLPVGWQYLVNNQLSGPLDKDFFGTYDAIVQSCLQTGAKCIVDIHNYARWNGKIVGQGGPSNDDLVNVWTQLAQHYKDTTNVIFGIMNEPHDLDINQWATTVQAVVTAIRKTDATSQWILLPGNDWTAVTGFQTSSAPALSVVKNPDGTTTNLIYDIHKYFDGDGAGIETECVTNHIADGFQPLGDYLRQEGRQALLTETGGGNTNSCVQYVCEALAFMNSYKDVYLGWTGWGAGSFNASYEYTETPNGDADTMLVSQCIAGEFR